MSNNLQSIKIRTGDWVNNNEGKGTYSIVTLDVSHRHRGGSRIALYVSSPNKHLQYKEEYQHLRYDKDGSRITKHYVDRFSAGFLLYMIKKTTEIDGSFYIYVDDSFFYLFGDRKEGLVKWLSNLDKGMRVEVKMSETLSFESNSVEPYTLSDFKGSLYDEEGM